MGTIIRSISFKNFYNYSGDYCKNTYDFTEGINIVNADNGMGKSKLFNGFLWILRDKVYDSDTRSITDINSAPLKILSDMAKNSDALSSEAGVKIIYDDTKYQYTIEKYITYTKKNKNASFNDPKDWQISDVITRVTKCLLDSLSRPLIVYNQEEQITIIRNLVSPTMHSYALLQGEAIDNIVDLSDARTLTATIETLTDLSSLKLIEKTCQCLTKNAKYDLSAQQKNLVVNLAQFDDYTSKKEEIEKQIDDIESELEVYQNEYTTATEIASKLQSQVLNTEERIRFQTECKNYEKRILEKENEYQKKLANINNHIFKQAMPWLLINTGNFVQKYGELRDNYTMTRTARKIVSDPQRFATLLPEGSPDDISLKKMLKEHQCFVCGRKFSENSEEEEKIKALLARSSSHSKVEESDLYLYFDSIQRNVAGYMKTDTIFAAIADEKREINNIKKELIDLRQQKRDAESEYYNYGGTKESLNSEHDSNLLAKYSKANKDVEKYENYINQAKKKLDDLRIDLDSIERKISNLDGTKEVPRVYIELKDTITDTEEIFENTRKRIYEEVLRKLETKSNSFYEKLTSGNNVMGGKMVFEKTITDTIEVKVITDTGSELTGASEGFQRMKKIAVIMAIISSRLGGGKFTYPFIADAPFSAFGKNFINNFFDTVPDVFDQSIILIKDLYDIDDPQCLSEDGHKILEALNNGKLKGTFYTNRIPNEADTTKLSTIIERYK